MQEIWKPILFFRDGVYLDFRDHYAVSNFGHIKSVKTGKLLSESVNQYGYKRVTLCSINNGKRKYYSARVHRMVAEMFLPNPDGLPQVNHLDGDKSNNAVTNLEWCDQSHNMRHAFMNNLFNMDTQRRLGLKGAKAVSIKINQYTHDWKYLCTYDSLTAAAKAVGYTTGNMIARYCKRPLHYYAYSLYRWRFYKDYPDCSDL